MMEENLVIQKTGSQYAPQAASVSGLWDQLKQNISYFWCKKSFSHCFTVDLCSLYDKISSLKLAQEGIFSYLPTNLK